MHRFVLLLTILLSAHPAWSSTVRIATVHYAPVLGDVAANRERIVELTEEAARNGAKFVVHTEMATSGYSFFSRREIAAVAETIPGETTRAIGNRRPEPRDLRGGRNAGVRPPTYTATSTPRRSSVPTGRSWVPTASATTSWKPPTTPRSTARCRCSTRRTGELRW